MWQSRSPESAVSLQITTVEILRTDPFSSPTIKHLFSNPYPSYFFKQTVKALGITKS